MGLGSKSIKVDNGYINKKTGISRNENWLDPANKFWGGVGVVATLAENLSGSAVLGIGTTIKIYGNGWLGNQYVTTYSFARMAKVLGVATLGVGTLLDIRGVYNYYKFGAKSNNVVHPAKATLNLGIGTWGLLSPATALGASLYYGIDNFYPGGWNGAMNIGSSLHLQNRAILGPRFNLYNDLRGW